jgi:hypothetical protein
MRSHGGPTLVSRFRNSLHLDIGGWRISESKARWQLVESYCRFGFEVLRVADIADMANFETTTLADRRFRRQNEDDMRVP